MEEQLSCEKEHLINQKIHEMYLSNKGASLFKALSSLMEKNNCYYYYIYNSLINIFDLESKKTRKKEIIDCIIYSLRFVLLSQKFHVLHTTQKTINTDLFFKFQFNSELNKRIKDINKEDAFLNEVICIYKYHTIVKNEYISMNAFFDFYESYFPLFVNYNKKRICFSWDYSFTPNSLDKKMMHKDYPECFILQYLVSMQDLIINRYKEKLLNTLENPINYDVTESFGEIIFMFMQQDKELEFLNALEQNNLIQFMYILPSLLETYGTIYNANLPLLMKNLDKLNNENAKAFLSTNLFIDYFHYFSCDSKFPTRNEEMIKNNLKSSLTHSFFDIFNHKKIKYFESIKDMSEFEIIDGSTFCVNYGFDEIMQLVNEHYKNNDSFSLIDLLSIIDGFNFPNIEDLFSVMNDEQYNQFIKTIQANFDKIKLNKYNEKYEYKNTILILEKEKFNDLLLDKINKHTTKL